MKLGEFIKQFSHNNIIRLHYKTKGGFITVLDTFDDVSMDHEVCNGKGPYRHYINNEVIGLVGIYQSSGHYTEAINIVIERLENQPIIDETIANRVFCKSN